MTDLPPATASNALELTVSELSARLKQTIETAYDFVRVRGELGRVTLARSGHMYADLKDENSVLSTVMWKGNVTRLGFKPEEGLEVIAEGRLSTYPGRSSYQLIADTMRPAGAGALMALLEERRRKLAAEGLFDAARKKALPFLPATIGVVTSPTGAVIRDILHRIRDRFPVRVIVWPALVQGELAAGQVAAGINGFNAMQGAGRPDVIIVARGGGSIEDLWPFNEEIVVRAAAASVIPLISGVGHETDTTLIDHAADRRAPTPTGAAEMAVPVRTDLALEVDGLAGRLRRALARNVQLAATHLKAAAARLPRPDALLGARRQRLDLADSRLGRALERRADMARKRLMQAGHRLPRPDTLLTPRRERLTLAGRELRRALSRAVEVKRARLAVPAGRLSAARVLREAGRQAERVTAAFARGGRAVARRLDRARGRLEAQGKLLETLSHRSVLARGFALVRGADGHVVRSRAAATEQARLTLSFADGDLGAVPEAGDPPAGGRRRARKDKPPGGQQTLF